MNEPRTSMPAHAEPHARMRVEPLIVAVAPNGARLRRYEHPGVPITARELAHAVADCVKAGASLVHLHVRDHAERHVLDVAGYERAIGTIRDATGEDVIVQITTESGGRYGPDEQMDVVRRVRPEAVSLGLREFLGTDLRAFASFLDSLVRNGVLVQYILFSPDEVAVLRSLRAEGILPGDRQCVLFVLGSHRGEPARPADLIPFVQMVDDDLLWFACAFGPFETACMLTAEALGGHVRVGFENNVVMANNAVAMSNSERVQEITATAGLAGRRPVTPSEARALLGHGRPG